MSGASHAISPAPPLVGRDRELATLRTHLDAALAGRGSLVLIGGEAGIGKTALAEALLAEAAVQGALVLVGRCYDLSETPALRPLGRGVRPRSARRRAARAADGGPAAGARRRGPREPGGHLRRVRDYFAALAATPARWSCCWTTCTGPTPPPSTSCASSPAASPAAPPCCWPPIAPRARPGHPLFTLLPLLVREARAARLDLRPLDREAIGALAAARYALTAADGSAW